MPWFNASVVGSNPAALKFLRVHSEVMELLLVLESTQLLVIVYDLH